MHMYQLLRKAVPALALIALALPASADAQLRAIVSKNVSASSSGATLELEFSDDGTLRIALEDGDVLVDGDAVASYAPGDALEVEWRSLLGQAMTLENGALAEMLVEWSAPASIEGAEAEAGLRIDQALEEALRDTNARVSSDEGEITLSIGEQGSLVQLLVNSMGRLGVLEEALEGLDENFRVHVDEDVTIEEGTTVEGTVVVIGGTLRVEGTIEGDAVVVDGAVDVRDRGRVDGEVRIADARIVRNSGEVRGGIVDVLEQERDFESRLRDELREEIRDEVRRDLRNEIRNVARFDDDESFSIMSPIRPVIRGVGGVVEKLIMVFVLGLLGAGFLAFAGENMDAIAETARRSPGRSAMVGLAGSFLLVPVWLLGAVALVVSIIGIPVAIAWVPLFPLAAGLAALLGYVTVARNAGEWLADSGFPWTGWIRKTNPVFTLVGGLLGLSAAFLAAHVISIAPFLGFLSGLLFAVGVMITLVAAQIGFGAVLLTRAGRRREYYGSYDADAAWEAAMNVDVGEGSDTSSKDEV
jgi:hypothetical protein